MNEGNDQCSAGCTCIRFEKLVRGTAEDLEKIGNRTDKQDPDTTDSRYKADLLQSRLAGDAHDPFCVLPEVSESFRNARLSGSFFSHLMLTTRW